MEQSEGKNAQHIFLVSTFRFSVRVGDFGYLLKHSLWKCLSVLVIHLTIGIFITESRCLLMLSVMSYGSDEEESQDFNRIYIPGKVGEGVNGIMTTAKL